MQPNKNNETRVPSSFQADFEMPRSVNFLSAGLIEQCESFRAVCVLAWEHRANPGMTKRTLAEVCDLYAPHVSDFFHRDAMDAKGNGRRSLPAEKIADVERAIGNKAISQYLARRAMLTLMEEVISARTHG